MKKKEIRIIQAWLNEQGHDCGAIDGQRGPRTDAAIAEALRRRTDTLPPDWQQWPAMRRAVALLQLICLDKGIDAGPVDGFYGPQTEVASERLQQLLKYGVLPRHFTDIQPVVDAHRRQYPRESDEALTMYYGLPCEVPLVKVECPWTLRLDWDLATTTRTITIHEKLAHSLEGILSSTWDYYRADEIKRLGLDRYGGSYNCRKKRGSNSAWSTHAWGIAIDWFPSKNKLAWRHDRASLAHPDLDPWWEIWEREGWISLGRREDRDWMHVQAARR